LPLKEVRVRKIGEKREKRLKDCRESEIRSEIRKGLEEARKTSSKRAVSVEVFWTIQVKSIRQRLF